MPKALEKRKRKSDESSDSGESSNRKNRKKTIDGISKSKQLLTKKRENKLTKPNHVPCESKAVTTGKMIHSNDETINSELEPIYENGNDTPICLDSSVDDLFCIESELQRNEVNKDCTKSLDLHQNTMKPLPSFIDLQQIFENDIDNYDCSENGTLKPVNTVNIKEKHTITKSKQLLIKKSNGKGKGQTVRPMPSFSDLEKMFEDDMPENECLLDYKNYEVSNQYAVSEKEINYPKSLRKSIDSNNKKNEEVLGILEENICTMNNDDINEVSVQQTINVGQENTGVFVSNTEDIGDFEIINEVRTNSRSESRQSNNTVIYDYKEHSPTCNRLGAFSPLPSTSNDNETFLKNDIRFNESLLHTETPEDEVEVIEIPVEVIEIPCETIILDDVDDENGQGVSQPNMENVNSISRSSSNEYYDTINIDESLDNDCEIVDVDVVINENKALLEKYRKNDANRNSEITNIENQRETTNDNRDPNNVTSRDTIGEIVRNFFTNNSPSTSVASASKKTYDYLMKITQSIVTTFSRSSNSENPPSNINDADIINLTNQSSEVLRDESVMILSASPHRRTVPISNINVSNEFPISARRTVPKKKKITKSKTVTVIEPSPPVEKRTIGDCPVCLDNLSFTAAASTMCGHIFCMKCIKMVYQSSGKKCPTCRKTLKGSKFHPVFLP